MPSITVAPGSAGARVGYTQVQQASGPGMPGRLQILAPAAEADAASATAAANSGVAAVAPAVPAADGSGLVMIQVVPKADPSAPQLGATVDELRAHLPRQAMVGGAAVGDLPLHH